MDNVQRKLMDARPLKAPPPPASIASSADGYESFENTSNKKKRKIPLSSSSSVHQSQLSAELANMGISSPHGLDGAADHANGEQLVYPNGMPASGGTGVSGAGRGRYSRQNPRAERRPLSGNPHSLANGYSSSLSARSRGGNWRGDGTKTKPEHDQGIISAAIASAAERPATPPKGKENVSLLSQTSPNAVVAASTPKTQFTFTCESDSSNKMVWPGQDEASYGTPTPHSQPLDYRAQGTGGEYRAQRTGGPAGFNARATAAQALDGRQAIRTGPSDPRMAVPGPPPAPNAPLPANGAPPQKPRRRRPSKEFALAARQRKLQQEYNNYHHKPKKEDMWICEFCEYEDIFGMPPYALIRQYEIKDRAERQKQEERRRLLEKAKMKKGKGKKGGKGAKNGAAQNPPPPNNQPYDQHLDNVPLPPDGQGDEYYDDEYDDDYDSVNAHDHPEHRVPGAYHDYGPDTYAGGTRGQHVAPPTPAA